MDPPLQFSVVVPLSIYMSRAKLHLSSLESVDHIVDRLPSSAVIDHAEPVFP
jgi:hypothetical protein